MSEFYPTPAYRNSLSTADVRDVLGTIPVKQGSILPLTEYGDGSARFDIMAGVPGSIINALTAPARAYRGEIAPDQMIPEGLNFAGSVALGSAAVPRPSLKPHVPRDNAIAQAIMKEHPIEKPWGNPETSSAPGLGLMAAAKQEPKGFTAYHGSPHDFDRFDMSKIGTGEGAQAYGHGLYFADSEGVARSYRDGLSDIGGGFKNLTRDENARVNYEAGQIEAGTATIDDMRRMWVNEIERRKSNLGEFFSEGDVREAQDRLAILNKAGDLVPSHSLGKLYQVRINADPDHFLDWDKPLSQQSEAVKRALADGGYERDAGFARNTLNPTIGDSELGTTRLRNPYSAFGLRDAGIPGIKYLDQGSRAAGEGSRNYVVFDDKLIEILKKYGLLGMIGGGMAASNSLSDSQL